MSKECEAIERFVQLLVAEQEILKKGDIDALAEFSEQKSMSANELNQYANVRSEWLIKQGLTANRQGMETWCKKNPTQKDVIELWGKVLELATRAHQCNRVNGEMISLRMKFNEQAIALLNQGKNTLSLYGSDGHSSSLMHRSISDSA